MGHSSSKFLGVQAKEGASPSSLPEYAAGRYNLTYREGECDASSSQITLGFLVSLIVVFSALLANKLFIVSKMVGLSARSP